MHWFFYRIKCCSEAKWWKFFLNIDLSNAYLQTPVEEESLELFCINTHWQLYKFEHLLFRVKFVPAIFQQVLDTMLSDLDFSVVYLDDILMESKSIVKHKDHVHKVFSKIQDYGFKIKETKCDFFMVKIKYLGHIIDKDGRRPDPEWAVMIKDMPAPDNITSLQSFCGLANYYQVFTQKMHDLHALLNELLKKNKPWDWIAEFEKIKKTLTSELFLTHYNPDLEIIVASD